MCIYTFLAHIHDENMIIGCRCLIVLCCSTGLNHCLRDRTRVPTRNYTGKRPQRVWGVGSHCTRYKQQQLWKCRVRPDIAVTAAAGTCFGTRSEAMSTHPTPIPGPQTRTSMRISTDCKRKTFYGEDLRRSSHRNFLWTSQRNCHTKSECNRLPRKIPTGSPQDLLTRTCTRSCTDT